MSTQPPVPPAADSPSVDPSWPPPYPEDGPDVYADNVQLVVKDAGVILGVLALLGVVCGVLWRLLVDPAQMVRVDGGVSQTEVELARMFAYDGWYVVVAAPTALLTGLVLTHRRTRDPLVTLVCVLVGCVLAALIMQGVGWALGPDDPVQALAHAKVGAVADAPLEVSGLVTFLAWPVFALLGSLIALLSRAD